MRLARYIGNGEVAIVEEPIPCLPTGGLLVRTEACGLCSGELMAWYMDRKIPHVLGHEVAGVVVESDAPGIPAMSRVYAHHHAPCFRCAACLAGHHVHCDTWRRTKLDPGGMAEFFAVGPELLGDTHVVNGLRAIDAALIEPLSCVVKSIRRSGWTPDKSAAVVGLGFMGLVHLLALKHLGADVGRNQLIGYERLEARRAYGESLGFDARRAEAPMPADVVFVCPGSESALAFAVGMVRRGGTVVLFSPFEPSREPSVDLNRLYFADANLVTSYSAGPQDSIEAVRMMFGGALRAEQVVSDFIGLDDLPDAYRRMASTEILKPMVVFGSNAAQ
jgi:L-iditol 2-dehydrogenase